MKISKAHLFVMQEQNNSSETHLNGKFFGKVLMKVNDGCGNDNYSFIYWLDDPSACLFINILKFRTNEIHAY